MALLAAMTLCGPSLSARELDWMARYSRTIEGVVHGPPWLFAAQIWLALGPVLGDPWTLATALAAALLLAGAARTRENRGDARLVAQVIAAVILLGALLALGPLIPRLGAMLYPSRFAPLLVLATAPLVDRALSRLRASRAVSRLDPSPLAAMGTLVLFACAVPQHLRVYQHAQPLATFADLRAIDCLARQTPQDAVIESLDGDASAWIPALTGRRITTPHKHCSLFDELDQALAPLHPAYRFRGEGSRGSDLVFPPAPIVCTRGDAHLWLLSPAPR